MQKMKTQIRQIPLGSCGLLLFAVAGYAEVNNTVNENDDFCK